MPYDRVRKTSVPISFHFTHSKRAIPVPEDAPRAASSPLWSRRRPEFIIIPKDTPAHRDLPTAVQPEWTPVEIANFPPYVRHSDLTSLLRGYNISHSFAFPVNPCFTRPFRATVLAVSAEEGRRMVKELDGVLMGERRITVRMKHMGDNERKECLVQDMANQIKTAIMNTAQMYQPDLVGAILEVHETFEDETQFAFLQQRTPPTGPNSHEAQDFDIHNVAEWRFVAGFSYSPDVEPEDSDILPRLEALKGLQRSLEDQGVLGKIWHRWSESQHLVTPAV